MAERIIELDVNEVRQVLAGEPLTLYRAVNKAMVWRDNGEQFVRRHVESPHGERCHILAVREPFAKFNLLATGTPYQADLPADSPILRNVKWHPPRYMPKELVRLYLRIVDVATERHKAGHWLWVYQLESVNVADLPFHSEESSEMSIITRYSRA